MCGSSVGIEWISTESWLLSPSDVSGFQLVRIPTTLPQSGWFANHSKSFIRFSYIICAFTYHIVELLFVLSYIRSRVWGSIEYSGTRCGDNYMIPRRLTTLIRQKILDSAVDEVSKALSMHVVPPAIRIRWKLLQLAFIRLRIILFGLRTANKLSGAVVGGICARLVFLC
jgi:hypothetical protein